METFSALLALCAGNSPVPGEFPAQRPVTRGFDVFFDVRLNQRLSKQSWGWWFVTTSSSLWHHCNAVFLFSCSCGYINPSGFLRFIHPISSGLLHLSRGIFWHIWVQLTGNVHISWGVFMWKVMVQKQEIFEHVYVVLKRHADALREACHWHWFTTLLGNAKYRLF